MNNTAAPECAAHNPTTTIPAGWKLVPVEPTQEMVDAALSKQDIYTGRGSLARIGYQAMLSAAPQAPVHRSWQPIKTAPKDGDPMLLFYNGAVKYGEWYHSKRKDSKTGWRVYHSGIYSSMVVDTPTHWMPLPAAPDLNGEG